MSEKSAWQLYKEKTQNKTQAVEQFRWVDPQIYSKRLLTCIGCPAFDKQNKTCAECGCQMVLKSRLPNADCPLGKWNLSEN